MKRAIAALIGLIVLVSFGAGAMTTTEGSAVSGDVAQQKLIDGNKRYVDAKLSHPNQTAQRPSGKGGESEQVS